jgi:phospholipid/cholesterol/gamma-HCH transport system substrate-binding protein/paraquat-inducible protein B
VAGIIVLGLGSLFERKFSVETYFDESVQGLALGAPLRYRGVTIGSVEQIDFVANQYRELNEVDQFRYGSYILVRVGIKEVFPGRSEKERPDELVRRVQDGLRVRLTSQGVTGVVYLEADYYDPNDYPPLPITWTPKSLYVPSGRSTVTVLGTALNKIAKDLEQAQVHKVTADLDKLIVSLTKVADETDMKQLTAQAGQTMGDVQRTLQQARSLLSNPHIERIMTDAAATAAELLLASKQLPATVMRLDNTVRRVDHLIAGKSQDIDEILGNLRIVSADLRELMTNAKRYPSQVLLGEPPSHAKAGKR